MATSLSFVSLATRFPLELLSLIVCCIAETDGRVIHFKHETRQKRRSRRKVLARLCLVCKLWSARLRPILFRTLVLRSIEDVRSLDAFLCDPHSATSSVFGLIQEVWVHRVLFPHSHEWLHYLHGLTSRHQAIRISCYIERWTDDPESIESSTASPTSSWTPFAFIPPVPPSYVRLRRLELHNIHFESTTDFARLIDNFSTLESCDCSSLSFLHVPPCGDRQSRRRRRHASRPLRKLAIRDTQQMATYDLAKLASDVLLASLHLDLEDRAWRAVLMFIGTSRPEFSRCTATSIEMLGSRGWLGM